MLSKIYLVIGVLIILAFAAVVFTGTELGSAKRERVSPTDLRSGRGTGIFFWHSGYRGGK